MVSELNIKCSLCNTHVALWKILTGKYAGKYVCLKCTSFHSDIHMKKDLMSDSV